MYKFRDVIEASEEYVLPSEALKINGVYIEDQISGYRTLSVSGREALSPDVVSETTGIRDGSRLKSKRYPERIIVVKYQLIAKSDELFREAYNKLGRILDVEEAELIFADEQDKYFVGTPCIIDQVDPGRNAVVGKFEILCTDPFKYSVAEFQASPDLDTGSILIDYNGTYKAFPILETRFYEEDEGSGATLTGAGDCGFVSFFNENAKIIQLGDENEEDGETYAKAQTLINQTFLSETAWGTTARNLWTVNKGPVPTDNFVQTGSVAMAKDDSSGYYLTPSSYGSVDGKWHGPAITRQVKADAAGVVGAANFTLTYKQKMCIGNSTGSQNQLGAFQVQLADASGNNVLGIKIAKRGAGKSASLEFYIAGSVVHKTNIDLHYNNDFFGSSEKAVKTTTITKSGSIVTFSVGSYERQFIYESITSTKVTQVTFMFYRSYKGSPLAYNGLYWAKFVKNNCDTFEDMPNKFSANDVLQADCNSGEVLLNGVSMPGLGALGNDWEEFALTPGLNQIGFAYSDWVTADYAPSFRVRYREVFL